MKAKISEFSYGYALTENLIGLHPSGLRAAPVFPSLVEEGKHGGYDVRLDFVGMPLFLQFKLTDYLHAANARERKAGIWSSAYYRMPLRASSDSQQHQLLLEWEESGEAVYYATPSFYEVAMLNRSYALRTVCTNSVFFAPTAIGALPTDDTYAVSFSTVPASPCAGAEPTTVQAILYPTGKKVEGLCCAMLFSQLAGKVKQFEARSKAEGEHTVYEGLRRRMVNIIKSNFSSESLQFISTVSNLHPLLQVTYLARTFFGCEILTLGREAA
jgi:hypothetical protein